jgi:xylan 1,4-beta-xylosidase
MVDADHGDARQAWSKMGSPASPTRDQVVKLRQAAELPQPEKRALSASSPSRLEVTLPAHALALVEVSR